jgi:hypothetical protein
MLNAVGLFLQNLRGVRGEKAIEMAEKLECTPPFLSAVSHGKDRCPDSWMDKIPELYSLDKEQKQKWISAVIYCNQNIKFLYDRLSDEDKNIVLTLANFIDTMKPSHKKAIKNLIDEGW